MRVLVTGATGFVGIHTVRALIAAGHTVRLGVRDKEKMVALARSLHLPPLEMAVGDITDPEAINSALEDCDALVHAAALVSMDPAKTELMQRTNVEGTKTVINAALNRGIKSIVYVSSAAALYHPKLTGIDENTPLATPQSAYARSKATAEIYVQECIEAGANIAITYPAAVVGPDDPGISEGNRSLQILLKYTHINTSSGVQMIDVRDLAQAQVCLLEQQRRGPFIVGGHYLTWPELGQKLEAVTQQRLLKLPIPGRALRVLGSSIDLVSRLRPVTLPLNREAMNLATQWVICDDTKLRKELGITHRPIEDTIADTVLWLAAQGHIPKKWGKKISR